MKIVIDINLSPKWVLIFAELQIEAVHWQSLGSRTASDETILKWAYDNTHIVFTHDLDFGAILAITQAEAPSVIQVRARRVSPSALAPLVVPVLKQFESQLRLGVLLTIDESGARARILPILKSDSR